MTFLCIILLEIAFIDCIENCTLTKHLTARLVSKLKLAMDLYEVVPDVIDTIPTNSIKIKYSDVEVNLGNELTPTSVKDIPIEIEWPTEQNALYTLCFTDPDAPSRADPKFREFKHWLVVNIPGTQISAGQTLTDYVGSGPPKDTGLHRYVFLVYKQPATISPTEAVASRTSREGRRSFRIREFAKKYNLGEPIAGNFYRAQFDDYVPILHAQFTS